MNRDMQDPVQCSLQLTMPPIQQTSCTLSRKLTFCSYHLITPCEALSPQQEYAVSSKQTGVWDVPTII